MFESPAADLREHLERHAETIEQYINDTAKDLEGMVYEFEERKSAISKDIEHAETVLKRIKSAAVALGGEEPEEIRRNWQGLTVSGKPVREL